MAHSKATKATAPPSACKLLSPSVAVRELRRTFGQGAAATSTSELAPVVAQAAHHLGAGPVDTSLTGGTDLEGSAVVNELLGNKRAVLALLQVVSERDAARQAQAQMAVAEERLRFSHDVHDVLGRRLSTIGILSELAATMAERGDARAAAQMLEVRGIAHEALIEARELARGYRPVNLAQEVEGARLLLRSAGIQVELDVKVVPCAWHEAAGWVVRESVTNVLRHSKACGVSISFLEGELIVVNDGAPTAHIDGAGIEDGAGLRGLRERLEPLGATLVAEGRDERWVVLVRLPGTGPTSGTATTPTSDQTLEGPGRRTLSRDTDFLRSDARCPMPDARCPMPDEHADVPTS